MSRMRMAVLAAVAVMALAAPVHAMTLGGEVFGAFNSYGMKDWQNAIRLLSSAALRDTRNAEIQNYLGYAYRNTGELSAAFKHYARALQINPRHRGAHEYLGEAYLMVNNVAKAEEHLAALKGICLIPCDEAGILERKIGEYRKGK